jgi:hypothetical protein
MTASDNIAGAVSIDIIAKYDKMSNVAVFNDLNWADFLQNRLRSPPNFTRDNLEIIWKQSVRVLDHALFFESMLLWQWI